MNKSTQGFTLIEVLISILIMSVGVLGATGLQLRGLDANRQAFFRGEATLLASDIINRIQINSDQTYGPVALTTTPSAVTDCNASTCSPAQMTAYDINQWLCSVNSLDVDGNQYAACADFGIQGSLPLGRASIARTGDEYAIRVEWTDTKSNQVSFVNFVVAVS